MLILGLDTSGPACSAAVCRDGALIQEIVMNTALTHSETLMPAVEQALESANAALDDVDVISVVAGPGSFTGVRIGVCAAKALAHAAKKKLYRANALEALAAGAANAAGIICPILDARRGQVYAAAFEMNEDCLPVRVMEDEALPLTEFIEKLPKDQSLYFTGDGVAVYEKTLLGLLGSRARLAPPHARILRASSACTLAMTHADEFMEPQALTPIYLRLPQAERERNERETRRKVC